MTQDRVAEDLAALERRLRGVRETAMRREIVLEALESRALADAYGLVHEALARRAAESPELPVLRDALEEVLLAGGAGRPLAAELRDGLAAEAEARGDERVLRLLRPSHAAQAMLDPAAALPRAVAEIPLGVRRSLAKGVDRRLLERLLLDADPLVVTHLLANPRITEEDVIRIAARRPIASSTLSVIFRSARFGRRPRVRLALARNPYCPLDVAVRALGNLGAADLREIAGDATLHADVRRHADEELLRRSPDVEP